MQNPGRTNWGVSKVNGWNQTLSISKFLHLSRRKRRPTSGVHDLEEGKVIVLIGLLAIQKGESGRKKGSQAYVSHRRDERKRGQKGGGDSKARKGEYYHKPPAESIEMLSYGADRSAKSRKG